MISQNAKIPSLRSRIEYAPLKAGYLRAYTLCLGKNVCKKDSAKRGQSQSSQFPSLQMLAKSGFRKVRCSPRFHYQFRGDRTYDKRKADKVRSPGLNLGTSPYVTTLVLKVLNERCQTVEREFKLWKFRFMFGSVYKSLKRSVEDLTSGTYLLNEDLLCVKIGCAIAKSIVENKIVLFNEFIKLVLNWSERPVSCKERCSARNKRCECSDDGAPKPQPLFWRGYPITFPNWTTNAEQRNQCDEYTNSNNANHAGVSFKIHLMKMPVAYSVVERFAA